MHVNTHGYSICPRLWLNAVMDKYEHRRICLQHLISEQYGSQVAFSKATKINPTYVSRMLYPEGKKAKAAAAKEAKRQERLGAELPHIARCIIAPSGAVEAHISN